MEKLFKSFKKIFSSSNFFDLGDEIVSYIQNVETGICIVNFKEVSEKLFEVKCDLIDRTNANIYNRIIYKS